MTNSLGKMTAVALALAALLVPVRAQALENEDLLALVAMPLAVAAVSEMTDVPMNDLVDMVTLLNDAQVAPAQFLEVVRYSPVALVAQQPAEQDFVDYVRFREQEGLRGTDLVTSIENHLRDGYDLDVLKLSVDRPRVVDVTDTYIPNVVRERLADVRQHPHGGPPGQLKKAAGVQTGAEIVHGTSPVRRIVNPDRDDRDGRPAQVATKKKHTPKQVKVHEARTERDQPVLRIAKNAGGDAKPHGGKAHGGGKPHGGKGHGKGKG